MYFKTKFMKICGIDDAGRGSMLGPLVIAGVSLEKKNLRKLTKLGVKDSKKLSSKSREILYEKIIETVDNYYIIKISPRCIDASVKKHLLNNLEAKYMAKVVSKLDADTSYVDSCDVKPLRFGKEISYLSGGHKIKSYHHADSRFVVVSAASILAKVTRDKSIERLKKIYNLGSGYPSDSTTVTFVTEYYKKNHIMPVFVRKSWKPVQKIIDNN